MNRHTTVDPISGHEVPNPETAPCVYDGGGYNGIEISFENEADRHSTCLLATITALHSGEMPRTNTSPRAERVILLHHQRVSPVTRE